MPLSENVVAKVAVVALPSEIGVWVNRAADTSTGATVKAPGAAGNRGGRRACGASRSNVRPHCR